MLVMIEGGSYLSVPDSYGYKTEAEEGATGAVAFTAWGGQAAPNQTFSLAFTLACDKVRAGACVAGWQRDGGVRRTG
eukprot:64781-Chlamydomonas_euryale.AAC.7